MRSSIKIYNCQEPILKNAHVHLSIHSCIYSSHVLQQLSCHTAPSCLGYTPKLGLAWSLWQIQPLSTLKPCHVTPDTYIWSIVTIPLSPDHLGSCAGA